MNIQDSSSTVYWTNSTERKEDYNTTRSYTDTGSTDEGPWSGWFPPRVSVDYDKDTQTDTWTYYDPDTNRHYAFDDSNSSTAEYNDVSNRNTANLLGNSTSVSFISTNVPGTRTWPMWIFWVVACTLVLGSIVIPVIGGRAFRYLVRGIVRCQDYMLHHRRRTRAAAAIFWLA